MISLRFRRAGKVVSRWGQHGIQFTWREAGMQSEGKHHPREQAVRSRNDLRKTGVYYTPTVVAEKMAALAFAAWRKRHDGSAIPQILDPACGDGALLAAAIRELQRFPSAATENWATAVTGWDIDSAAVQAAQQNLTTETAGGSADWPLFQAADALDEAHTAPSAFDIILSNPPYLSIRELARTQGPAAVADYRRRFATARGNFDLYLLFLERACRWLRPGGVAAFIIPNKFAALDYALAARQLLLQQTSLVNIVDLSSLKIFPQAHVYPQIIVFRQEIARCDSTYCVSVVHDLAELQQDTPVMLRTQVKLRPERFTWAEEFDVEERIPTQPFGERSRLHSGATGFAAQRLAGVLRERRDQLDPAARDFIVSGNIDPFVIRPKFVRFLRHDFQQPTLSLASPFVTQPRRELYASPKIVIAGMSRRIEAAWDEVGLALGVQVFAANQLQDDPFLVLGILNSQLLSQIYQQRFAAKKMAGGYFTMNKGQLAQLPLPRVEAMNSIQQQQCREIAELAKQMHLTAAAGDLNSTRSQQEIDQRVAVLYQVDRAEINPLGSVRRAA